MSNTCNSWLDGKGNGSTAWAVLAVFRNAPQPQMLAVDLRIQTTGFGATDVVVDRDVVTLELHHHGECPATVALEVMSAVAEVGVCPDAIMVGEPRALEPGFTLEARPFKPAA